MGTRGGHGEDTGTGTRGPENKLTMQQLVAVLQIPNVNFQKGNRLCNLLQQSKDRRPESPGTSFLRREARERQPGKAVHRRLRRHRRPKHNTKINSQPSSQRHGPLRHTVTA
ncbi:hypothetical protein E2C01_016230 [Portunus trituberculatus]|uniref:Uncharacterized protein n=1 Tax=Portunus trituberculatus TaxID=210409 RepID=A0A5B7DNJ3_PORTR|nr:hypothetical protein [Portunus trituberculatus]